MKSISNIRFATMFSIVLVAALSRLLPHPYNFTPIGAIALFGGAYFSRKSLAFIVPLTAMLISDLMIGFHDSMLAVYASFVLIVLLGMGLLQKVTLVRLIGSSVLSSVLFFLITNFAVWYGADAFYPQTMAGLGACYVAGLQFYQNSFFGNLFLNSVMGDLFFTSLIFGVYELINQQVFSSKLA